MLGLQATIDVLGFRLRFVDIGLNFRAHISISFQTVVEQLVKKALSVVTKKFSLGGDFGLGAYAKRMATTIALNSVKNAGDNYLNYVGTAYKPSTPVYVLARVPFRCCHCRCPRLLSSLSLSIYGACALLQSIRSATESDVSRNNKASL